MTSAHSVTLRQSLKESSDSYISERETGLHPLPLFSYVSVFGFLGKVSGVYLVDDCGNIQPCILADCNGDF